MRIIRLALATAVAAIGLLPAIALAAGPPYPDPVSGQAVYDTAGVLRAETVAKLEAAIDAFEADTGAEVVVYTQLVPYGISDSEAEADAIALMDQWGVGRAGVDDGLVILFDLHEDDPCHGQVQLYAGPGFRETWLSNDDRQRIFENDMVPLLRECDIDGAAVVAMDKVAGAGTFRVLNAVLGLLLAPGILLAVIAGSLFIWIRRGKDPVYLDDPSILMPAPPPGLTPAAGAAIRDGSVTRRALTAASLDLAARGHIGFRAEDGGSIFGGKPEIGIHTVDAAPPDPVEQARLERVRRRPMDKATGYLLTRLRSIGGGAAYVAPAEILELGKSVSTFNSHLEKHLVEQRWFVEAPGKVSGRWIIRGILAFIGAFAVLFIGLNLPSSGLVLIGVALIVSALWLFGISGAMPSRTKDGAVIVAMLEAYRRTLEKTMAMSRSMGEVVATSAIPLIEDPDDAVVWGVALGLQAQVEEVLQRSAEDLTTGRASSAYMPMWYWSAGASWGDRGGGGGGWAPGMMSSSPIPNFGGMMAALGTIGNSPASSGSGGGGGGFSGGSSGGGGGGAGGGF
ncbi:MAG TPA: TPM domain-containing protein [Candidatus Limnocylindrales bacterium]|nr:TPM domain-containing protein [Candidatus Limnocylindrales bacterium]